MRPIATEVARSVVCLSVCVGHTEEPRENDWSPNPTRCRLNTDWSPKEPCIRWGAHLRHLVTTTERSLRGGDAALYQITLHTFYSVYITHVTAVLMYSNFFLQILPPSGLNSWTSRTVYRYFWAMSISVFILFFFHFFRFWFRAVD